VRAAQIQRGLYAVEAWTIGWQSWPVPERDFFLLAPGRCGPFLYLKQDIAREAAAEYVVYKEMPKDARISWLTTIVQQGCQIGKDKNQDEYNALMEMAEGAGVVWLLLLPEFCTKYSFRYVI